MNKYDPEVEEIDAVPYEGMPSTPRLENTNELGEQDDGEDHFNA